MGTRATLRDDARQARALRLGAGAALAATIDTLDDLGKILERATIGTGSPRTRSIAPAAPMPVADSGIVLSAENDYEVDRGHWESRIVLGPDGPMSLVRVDPKPAHPLPELRGVHHGHERGFVGGVMIDRPWLTGEAASSASAIAEARARAAAGEWKPSVLGRRLVGKSRLEPRSVVGVVLDVPAQASTPAPKTAPKAATARERSTSASERARASRSSLAALDAIEAGLGAALSPS